MAAGTWEPGTSWLANGSNVPPSLTNGRYNTLNVTHAAAQPLGCDAIGLKGPVVLKGHSLNSSSPALALLAARPLTHDDFDA